jgi:hypothetical protein
MPGRSEGELSGLADWPADLRMSGATPVGATGGHLADARPQWTRQPALGHQGSRWLARSESSSRKFRRSETASGNSGYLRVGPYRRPRPRYQKPPPPRSRTITTMTMMRVVVLMILDYTRGTHQTNHHERVLVIERLPDERVSRDARTQVAPSLAKSSIGRLRDRRSHRSRGWTLDLA